MLRGTKWLIFCLTVTSLIRIHESLRVRRGICSTRTLLIVNGDYRLISSNTIADFTCNRGYYLYGSSRVVCYGTKWSSDPPLCLGNQCPEIKLTEALSIERRNNNTRALFSCDAMHRLVGQKQLLCTGTSWNNAAPFCEAWMPPMSCDFEEENICSFYHHHDNNVDWKRHTGSTRTSRTGPEFDHTLGSGGAGHYMYFETSSPAHADDTAVLESPVYPAHYSGNYCLEFWLHFLGEDDVATFSVYIRPVGVNLTNLQPLYTQAENLGDEWVNISLLIPPQNSHYTINFQGIKSLSYRSDFAIDDVKLYECAERPKPTPSTTTATTTPTKTSTTTTTVTTTPPPTTTNDLTAQTTMPVSRSPSTTEIKSSQKLPTSPPNTHKTVTPSVMTSMETLQPRINPDVPSKWQSSPSDPETSTADEVYIGIGVGIVVVVAGLVGLGIFCYIKRPLRRELIEMSAANPCYISSSHNDEEQLCFIENTNHYDMAI